jgi:hypothetical protein
MSLKNKIFLISCLIITSNTWGEEVEVYNGKCGSFAQTLVGSKTVLSSAESAGTSFSGEFSVQLEEDIDFVLNGWVRKGNFRIGHEDSMLIYKGINGEWLLDSSTAQSYCRADKVSLKKNKTTRIHTGLRVSDYSAREWRVMFRTADKSKCIVSRSFHVELDREIELEGFVPMIETIPRPIDHYPPPLNERPCPQKNIL